MDMVKPMPANMPAPRMFFHFKSWGNAHNPKLTPIKEKRKTPKGFPTIRPAMMPILPGCKIPEYQLFSNVIQVFAKANNGRIKNATGL